MVIEHATVADAPACADLLRDLVDAHLSEFPKLCALPTGKQYEAVLGSDCSSDLLGRWRKWIKEPDWETLLARDTAGKIVAMVHFCPDHTVEGYDFEHAHIAHFVVSPGHRRRGYGRKLLRHVLDLEPSTEFRIATSTTAARGLWLQAGFVHQIHDWRESGVVWYGLSTQRPGYYSSWDGRWRSEWRCKWGQQKQLNGDEFVFTPTSITLTSDPESEIDDIVWCCLSDQKKLGSVRFRLTRGSGSVHRIHLARKSHSKEGPLYGKQTTTGDKTLQIVLRRAD